MYWLNLFFFSSLLTIIILSLTKKDEFCYENSFLLKKLHNKDIYNVLILLLFFFAFLVRIYDFPYNPAGFNQDEAMAAVDANALALYGTDHFGMKFPVYLTAWGFAQMNVFESVLMIPFIKIFGLSRLSARLPILLISLLSIFTLFDFTKKIFDKNIALVALFFICINPWHIMLSRWALESNFFPSFILFSLYFLFKGIEEKKGYLYLSMFLFGITMYTYGISYFTIPVLLLLLCLKFLKEKKVTFKEVIKCVLVYFLVSLPIYTMMFINFFKMESIDCIFFTIPYFKDAIRTNDLLIFSDNLPKQFLSNFYGFFKIVFLQFYDNPWNYINKIGPLYLFSMPLMLLGIYEFFKNTTFNKTGKTIIFIWFLVGCYSGIMVNDLGINQVNIIFFPIIIFCVLGLYRILFFETKKYMVYTPILFYLIAFCFFVGTYFTVYKKDLSYYFYEGFEESLQYAEEVGKSSPDTRKIYVTAMTQYEGAYGVSEVLTLFHNKIDPIYFQGERNFYDENAYPILPYNEKYIYIDYRSTYHSLKEYNAVYIFNQNERELFPEEFYHIVNFYNYGIALYKGSE